MILVNEWLLGLLFGACFALGWMVGRGWHNPKPQIDTGRKTSAQDPKSSCEQN